MGEIQLSGYLCERCEHIWVPRANSTEKPLVCPKCKSPYWNIPRKNPDPKKPKVKKGGKQSVVNNNLIKYKI